MFTFVCSNPLCLSSTFSRTSFSVLWVTYLHQMASLVQLWHTLLVPALSCRVTSSATTIAWLRLGYWVIRCPEYLLLSPAYLPHSDAYLLCFIQLLGILLCLFLGQRFLYGRGKCELLLRRSLLCSASLRMPNTKWSHSTLSKYASNWQWDAKRCNSAT